MPRKVDPRIEKYFEWVHTDVLERVPKTRREIAQQLGVTVPTLTNWDTKLQVEKEEDKIQSFRKFVYQQAMKGSAKHAELYARMNGLLNDKSEIRHKFEFTAEDHFRIRQEAESRLQEFDQRTDRVGVLPEKLSVLHEPLCESAGESSGNAADNHLGALALFAGPAGDITEP